MYTTSKASNHKPCSSVPGLVIIRSHIAASMIGQAVHLLVGSGQVTHGVVSGVQVEDGSPKILVEGSRYDLEQVLTVTPATLN
jgi:hypothetical protein